MINADDHDDHEHVHGNDDDHDHVLTVVAMAAQLPGRNWLRAPQE